MEFYNDPQEGKLREVQQYMRFWAWSQRERKRTGINPLYRMMMSVRNSEEELKKIEKKVKDKSEESLRSDLVLGRTIPILAIEKHLIAEKVDRIMNDPELWRGHYRDKEVLVSFYLDKSANWKGCNESIHPFSKLLRIPRWKVKNVVRSSLMYFSSLYGE